MNIRILLPDPAKEDLDELELLLVGRFDRICKGQAEKARENGDMERFGEIEALIFEHYSDDKKKCEEFLDWMASQEGEEKEDCYLYGIRDGIRAAKWFGTIWGG